VPEHGPFKLFVARSLFQHREAIKRAMQIEYDEAHKLQRTQALKGIIMAGPSPSSHIERSPVFMGLRNMYEKKYEGNVFWCGTKTTDNFQSVHQVKSAVYCHCRYGVFVIAVRLCETSFLIFFHKRSTRTLFATGIALISVVTQQETEPHINEPDGSVLYHAQWVVFLWLFALQANESLQAAFRPAVLGALLAVTILALVAYSVGRGN
jgi:hypothetical protein